MFNSKILVLFLSVLFLQVSNAQDLMSERIRKISDKKRSIYFKGGIFHSTNNVSGAVLKSIRHGYQPANGYERLVFDFDSATTPRVYGYKSEKNKKIFIDFFNTTIGNGIGSFGNSKYVDKVEFYPVGDESLSTEVILKSDYSIDIFYLTNPGRLVIDIKN
ncbi:hypothetical protein [Bacteriovorax sp. Seq25_V]|uniref:hypothetical protein n=1 Tax=Bacteriovorax sp. Seq25_V TaxID=1201288 RepID=UPI00038A18D7|nr:hypothetical protein [Bacteriovorax sp. Seq25_V]EQC43457.1 hypothetical protein M900_0211 [Bacteriovorax sp. Seq25_V]